MATGTGVKSNKLPAVCFNQTPRRQPNEARTCSASEHVATCQAAICLLSAPVSGRSKSEQQVARREVDFLCH